MIATDIYLSILSHTSPPLEHWRIMKRSRLRVHPYDGMELPIPSVAWLYLLADSPEEADKAISMVSAYGIPEFKNPNSTANSQHIAVFKTLTFFLN